MAGQSIWYELVTPDPQAKAAVEAHGGLVTEDLQEIRGGEFVFTAANPRGARVGFVGPKGA